MPTSPEEFLRNDLASRLENALRSASFNEYFDARMEDFPTIRARIKDAATRMRGRDFTLSQLGEAVEYARDIERASLEREDYEKEREKLISEMEQDEELQSFIADLLEVPTRLMTREQFGTYIEELQHMHVVELEEELEMMAASGNERDADMLHGRARVGAIACGGLWETWEALLPHVKEARN